ncbi:MAG TPA: ferredoxin reductase [Anaeromyxobacteraceae bacterium]|nr:ferredoxin reductase [Anaeromyxobacteraceae bacterium]
MTAALRMAGYLARHLLLDRQAEFWLGELNPLWSSSETRARVVAVVEETADTRTFVLRPNTGWRGHRAGQHTAVEVEIDGVRLRRCYSVSSAPADRLPAITVKRMRGGRVSGWIHENVRQGHVLSLGPVAGDFVLPDPPPAKLLMLSGGSGITPVMSMLRELAARGAVRDLVFMHHARSRADVIFGNALTELAGRHCGLRLLLCLGDSASGSGRFDEARLRELVPDYAERETFLCGPPALMERAGRTWERAGATGRLRRERFVPVALPSRPAAGAPTVRVCLTRSGRSFAAAPGTLLDQLERAGEHPAFGCRMGICQTCRCRKQAGAVENLLTGAVSSEPDQDIQLCISAPRSDVELCL